MPHPDFFERVDTRPNRVRLLEALEERKKGWLGRWRKTTIADAEQLGATLGLSPLQVRLALVDVGREDGESLTKLGFRECQK